MPSERVKHRDVTYRFSDKCCAVCLFCIIGECRMDGFIKTVHQYAICNEFVRHDAKPYDGPPYADPQGRMHDE
jgi:hypothetical protein